MQEILLYTDTQSELITSAQPTQGLQEFEVLFEQLFAIDLWNIIHYMKLFVDNNQLK